MGIREAHDELVALIEAVPRRSAPDQPFTLVTGGDIADQWIDGSFDLAPVGGDAGIVNEEIELMSSDIRLRVRREVSSGDIIESQLQAVEDLADIFMTLCRAAPDHIDTIYQPSTPARGAVVEVGARTFLRTDVVFGIDFFRGA